MTSRNEMEAVLEAILFVTSEAVSRQRLLSVFHEREREEAALALESVLNRYRLPGQGVMVDEAAGGVRLVTRPELNGYLRRFFEVSGRNRLSMAALETLTIVAYRQPMTGPEIQELRGVNSSGVLKTLLERRLIRISGRKEVVGKPFLYSTTREFLLHFGIASLKDLPPLEEFEEILAGDADLAADGQAPGDDREEGILRQAVQIEEEEELEEQEKREGELEEETAGPAASDVAEEAAPAPQAAAPDEAGSGEAETSTEEETAAPAEAETPTEPGLPTAVGADREEVSAVVAGEDPDGDGDGTGATPEMAALEAPLPGSSLDAGVGEDQAKEKGAEPGTAETGEDLGKSRDALARDGTESGGLQEPQEDGEGEARVPEESEEKALYGQGPTVEEAALDPQSEAWALEPRQKADAEAAAVELGVGDKGDEAL